jgi:hypothetical protein
MATHCVSAGISSLRCMLGKLVLKKFKMLDVIAKSNYNMKATTKYRNSSYGSKGGHEWLRHSLGPVDLQKICEMDRNTKGMLWMVP